MSDGRDVLHLGVAAAPASCRASLSGQTRPNDLVLGLIPPPRGSAAEHARHMAPLLPLREGRRADYAILSTGGILRFHWHVGSAEDILVPAGRFRAWPITLDVSGMAGDTTELRRTFWIAVENGVLLRVRTSGVNGLADASPDAEAAAISTMPPAADPR